MTNKELQKLGRRELLQLLLDQAKESERLGKLLKENDEHLKQLEESYERLRERLDKKDAQIHQLKDQLQACSITSFGADFLDTPAEAVAGKMIAAAIAMDDNFINILGIGY